jgi:hypothetical protein
MSAAWLIANSRQLREAKAEIARLRAGLRCLIDHNYDAGYSAEAYAQLVLDGVEPPLFEQA